MSIPATVVEYEGNLGITGRSAYVLGKADLISEILRSHGSAEGDLSGRTRP
jgi:hypothetical protein